MRKSLIETRNDGAIQAGYTGLDHTYILTDTLFRLLYIIREEGEPGIRLGNKVNYDRGMRFAFQAGSSQTDSFILS